MPKREEQNLIFVNITTRCNFNCPHCYRRSVDLNKTLQKDIPLSLFEKIIKDFKKYSFQRIVFTGGEPILHPEFERLVELAAGFNYHYMVLSNGFLYQKYWPIIKRFREFCFGINFSLDGATAEVHDGNRNQNGSFQKVIEAINFYVKNEMPVSITTCLTKKNYHQIEEIAFLCRSLGVNSLRYDTAIEVIEQERKSYILLENERKRAIEKIKEISNKIPLKIFICPALLVRYPNTIDFCPRLSSFQKLGIDYEGGMLFCASIYRECKGKPQIKEGIIKGLKDNIAIASEIRKQRLEDISQGIYFDGFNTCEYCNRYIEKIIKK